MKANTISEPKASASRFTAVHVEYVSDRAYAEVVSRFEQQLGRFDPNAMRSLTSQKADPADIRSAIECMDGPSGLMLFSRIEHGEIFSVLGTPKNAVQIVLGNPLIAIEMTRHDLGASLYAPLRAVIFEDADGRTHLEYDQPSSLFGRLNDDRILAVARQLDAKMEKLAIFATA